MRCSDRESVREIAPHLSRQPQHDFRIGRMKLPLPHSGFYPRLSCVLLKCGSPFNYGRARNQAKDYS